MAEIVPALIKAVTDIRNINATADEIPSIYVIEVATSFSSPVILFSEMGSVSAQVIL